MNPLRRIAFFVFSLLILAQAIVLWGATGSKNTTTLPNGNALSWMTGSTEVTALTDSPSDKAKDRSGDEAETGEFHFGLFPSRQFRSPQIISVITLGVPALLMALMAMAPAGEKQK